MECDASSRLPAPIERAHEVGGGSDCTGVHGRKLPTCFRCGLEQRGDQRERLCKARRLVASFLVHVKISSHLNHERTNAAVAAVEFRWDEAAGERCLETDIERNYEKAMK